MANSKISALTSASTPLAGTETLPIVQSGATVKVPTNDLTVRNIRAAATTGILQVSGPTAGATRTATVPDANWTAARTDAAQSFTGDQTLSTGNLTQGTAAKGFNFTANTPVAGMTSQLLNWYEQGSFTATLTSATPPTAAITETAYYTRIGDEVTVHCAFRGVDNTGAAGAIRVTGLPFTSNAAAYSTGSVWCLRSTTTNGLSANVSPSTTAITLLDFSGNTVSWSSTGGGVFAGFQITYKV
jgi:hypothetical protein